MNSTAPSRSHLEQGLESFLRARVNILDLGSWEAKIKGIYVTIKKKRENYFKGGTKTGGVL